MTRRRFLATGGLPITGGDGEPVTLIEGMAGRGLLETRARANTIATGATGYGRRYRIDFPYPVSALTLRWEGIESGTYTGAPVFAAVIEGGPAVTFSGVDQAAHPAPGTSLNSDPITLPAPATFIWLRVWYANATGTSMPAGDAATRNALGEAFTPAAMTKATVLGGTGVGAGWSAAGATASYVRPGAAFAEMPDTATSLVTVGDSIGTGNSYLVRATVTAGLAARNSSYGGQHAGTFVSNFTARQPGGLSGYTLAVSQLGLNDLSSGTITEDATALIAVWARIETEGVPAIWQCTITPAATSTDGFATLANQTPVAWADGITEANDWLRDGAPITAARTYAPVGTVTAGTLRAGDEGHYLARIVDVAAAVQDPDDERLWRAPTSSTPSVGGTYGGDGVHPTTWAHDAMAAVLAAELATL